MSAIATHRIGNNTVKVFYYDDVCIMSPRRDDRDWLLGTMLTWDRFGESPDENKWDKVEEWMADMLDGMLGSKQLFEAARNGEFDNVRVVELDGKDDDGAIVAVQGYGPSALNRECSWFDVLRLDYGDFHELQYGGDRRLARALADSPSAPKVLGGFIHLLPVYKFEHSGVSFNTTGYSDPWDSGQVGFIYCTHDRAVELLGSEVTEERALDVLRKEVDQYSKWANGEAYMVHVRGDDRVPGKPRDSSRGKDRARALFSFSAVLRPVSVSHPSAKMAG